MHKKGRKRKVLPHVWWCTWRAMVRWRQITWVTLDIFFLDLTPTASLHLYTDLKVSSITSTVHTKQVIIVEKHQVRRHVELVMKFNITILLSSAQMASGITYSTKTSFPLSSKDSRNQVHWIRKSFKTHLILFQPWLKSKVMINNTNRLSQLKAGKIKKPRLKLVAKKTTSQLLWHKSRIGSETRNKLVINLKIRIGIEK